MYSWKVKTEGAGPYEFEAVMDTKEEAERVAKEHARAQAELVGQGAGEDR